MAIYVDIKNFGGRDLIEGMIRNYYDKLGVQKSNYKAISSIIRKPIIERKTLKDGILSYRAKQS